MRIEIDIRDDIEPEVALECIANVILSGRISKGEHGKMYYCWLTAFKHLGEEIFVCSRQYRKNDCFVVYKKGKRV